MFPRRLDLARSVVRGVPQAEYARLLGYPPDAEPDGRVRRLMRAARDWCSAHARPSVELAHLRITTPGERTVAWETERRGARGRFHGATLARRLREADVRSLVAIAISSGREVEGEIEFLTGTGEVVEAMFLDRFGAALVEWLLFETEERLRTICAENGLGLLPAMGPGHEDWTLSDQRRLLGAWDARTRGLQLTPTGMLRPRNALLVVCGLTPSAVPEPGASIPCPRCSFTPCTFRRSERAVELFVD